MSRLKLRFLAKGIGSNGRGESSVLRKEKGLSGVRGVMFEGSIGRKLLFGTLGV
jgi:hypothetical protein